jgi:hypothetical protein
LKGILVSLGGFFVFFKILYFGMDCNTPLVFCSL